MKDITLHNFKDQIDEIIVGRGNEYYEAEAVNDLEELDNGRWCALVEGTEVYEVRVSLEGDIITESICDCPFDFGPVCKHEVAVYFAIRERLHGGKVEKVKRKPTSKKVSEKTKNSLKRTTVQNIDEIINNLGFDGLSSIVREYSMENRDFRNVLLANAVHFIDEPDVEEYRNIIRAPINAAAHYGFIEYRDTGRAMRGVNEVLFRAEKLLKEKQAARVIPICQALIEEMVKVVGMSDDSDGEMGQAIVRAFDMLAECSGMIDEKAAGELFNYCLREARHRRFDGWEDWWWDHIRIAAVLTATAQDERKLFKVIDKIERREYTSDWSREWAAEKAAAIKINYFKERKDEKRLAEFVNSRLSIKSVREEALVKALKKRDYVKSKELAHGGIEIAIKKGHLGTVDDWKKRLLDIAVAEKNREEVRGYARELFIGTHDFAYYDRFKKTFPEKEWRATLALLIDEIEKKFGSSRGRLSLLPGIFVREKKWQDLLEYVRGHITLELLEEHHRHLVAHFPSELYDLYEGVVRDMLAKNTGRSHYQRACRVLRKMKKLDRAKDVKTLVLDLGRIYNYRPALLDELRKV